MRLFYKRRRAQLATRGAAVWSADFFEDRQRVIVETWTLEVFFRSLTRFANDLYGEATHSSMWPKKWGSCSEYVAAYERVAAAASHADLFLFVEARLWTMHNYAPSKEAVRLELVRSMTVLGQRGTSGGSSFGFEAQKLGALLTLLGFEARYGSLGKLMSDPALLHSRCVEALRTGAIAVGEDDAGGDDNESLSNGSGDDESGGEHDSFFEESGYDGCGGRGGRGDDDGSQQRRRGGEQRWRERRRRHRHRHVAVAVRRQQRRLWT
jgi:hypothetical protein